MEEHAQALTKALQDVAAEAQEYGWDGYAASPVNPSAIRHAIQFLNLLPSGVPLPDVAVDPDGEIALDWDFGPRRIFSVRVGKEGTLDYAGLVGQASFHGSEVLREGIPGAILAGIHSKDPSPKGALEWPG